MSITSMSVWNKRNKQNVSTKRVNIVILKKKTELLLLLLALTFDYKLMERHQALLSC